MKYIKYTLWILLSFSIVFIALEIKKAVEQRGALIKAVELAEYGPQGKPKKIVLDSIKVFGSIYPETKYKISTHYSAQRDNRLCKSWSLFGGLSSSTKSHWYEPIIEDGRHNITVPLDVHSAIFGCKYKLKYINLSLDRGEYQLPSGSFLLFYPEQEQILNPPTYGFKRQNIPGKGDIINIECVLPDPDNIHYSPSPCGLAPVKNEIAVSQYLEPSIVEYEVNIQFLTQDEYQSALDSDVSKN